MEQQAHWHATAASTPVEPGTEGAQQFAASQQSTVRGVPKVPSLVFDIELEERTEGQGSSGYEHVGVRELTRWLLPSSTGEFKLRNDVEMGLAQHQQRLQPQPTALEKNQLLAAFLTRLGYRVHIRTALGGGEGFECLRNLRHVFLAVMPPGAHVTTNRFVVDLSFKEQFRIAKPTPRYQALLDCVPATYVAPEASVAPLVNFLCHEMALAFSTTGVVLPPWRQTHSMLSKWLPRKSLDEQVPRPSMALAPPGVTAAAPSMPHAAPRRSMDMSGQVHGHWVAAGHAAHHEAVGKRGITAAAAQPAAQQHAPTQQQQQPAAAKVLPVGMDARVVAPLSLRPPGGLIKPLSCEPQRVVVGGNFSAIGFA